MWFTDVDTRQLAVPGKQPVSELGWTLLQGRRLNEGFSITALTTTTAILYKEIDSGSGAPGTETPDAGAGRRTADLGAGLRATGAQPPTLAVQYVLRHDPTRGTLTTEVWLEPSVDPAFAEAQRAFLDQLASDVRVGTPGAIKAGWHCTGGQ